MPPDLAVPNQPEESGRGPATGEQGVGVHGEEEREHLAVGEAVEADSVVAQCVAKVSLMKKTMTLSILSEHGLGDLTKPSWGVFNTQF